ncbi:ORF6C domain-containing protein [Klebsiella quasipneumoniae]|uniref:ORF6C domain-containing protein n=1 Tax=Klebsiella quasipneumoniae TaxID=1463165 RepID=UPI0029846E67|nr:ORF6C domain-containing protein [Klebsiella quasipneumoniae]
MALAHDFKEFFEIPRYDALRKEDFDKAIEFVRVGIHRFAKKRYRSNKCTNKFRYLNWRNNYELRKCKRCP